MFERAFCHQQAHRRIPFTNPCVGYLSLYLSLCVNSPVKGPLGSLVFVRNGLRGTAVLEGGRERAFGE